MALKKFFTNWIVRNLALAIAFVAVIVVAVSIFLSLYTRHGQYIAVPDFNGMSVAEARALAEANDIKVVVTDSVFVRRMEPGAVYTQLPKAGSHVKSGRKVRLTTNTMVPSEVYMPSLVGSSLLQAKSELRRSGLVLGRLIYVKDIATNYVLRQQRYGVDVAPGTPLTSGTTINLVLGLSTDDQTVVPDLVGLRLRDAVDKAQDNSLNVGRLRYDSTVQTYADSLAAVVYAQEPAFGSDAVRRGSEVTLRLTLNEDRLPPAKRK